MSKSEVSPGTALFGCLFVIVILCGISLFFGWLCKLIAGHFGFHQPLWIWALGWFLVTGIFRSASGGKS